MKKYTIFVTVEEFLENGGQLEEGGMLYTAMNLSGACGTFNSMIGDMVEIRQPGYFICLHSSIVYVQIEAKPIWK